MSRWYNHSSEPAPAVSLRRLWPEAKFIGSDDLLATGYATDPRRIQPGEVFVAIRLGGSDGHAQVETAFERGAAGVVVERWIEHAGTPQVVVPSTARALAQLAHCLAGQPSGRMEVVGVTGASGKTATLAFMRAILEAEGLATGVLGPEEWSEGQRWRPRSPMPAHGGTVAELLDAMAASSCSQALLELPFESLEAGGADYLELAAAVVGPLEEHAGPAGESADLPGPRTRLAARLVRALKPGGLAILDGDDGAVRWLEASRIDANILTFGFGANCSVRAEIGEMTLGGSRGVFRTPVGTIPFRLALLGRSSIRSAAAATAIGLLMGVSPEAICHGLVGVTSIPGRLERVDLGSDFTVAVDRGRTGAELDRALSSLRELVPGRLHCILSARADADSSTRAQLARVLETRADLVTLTPESQEDAERDEILDDHLALFRRPGRVRRTLDRQSALMDAMLEAGAGDLLLLAGRGRECGFVHPHFIPGMSDASLARAAWSRLQMRSHRRSA